MRRLSYGRKSQQPEHKYGVCLPAAQRRNQSVAKAKSIHGTRLQDVTQMS